MGAADPCECCRLRKAKWQRFAAYLVHVSVGVAAAAAYIETLTDVSSHVHRIAASALIASNALKHVLGAAEAQTENDEDPNE